MATVNSKAPRRRRRSPRVGDRLLVLGAGATRGAVPLEGRHCDPPLNADFFMQLQKIRREKHSATIEAVIGEVVDLLGPNFASTMEEYFTQLEAVERMIGFAHTPRASVAQRVANRERRDHLMTALAAVLEESTDVSRKDARVCQYHAAIVHSLQPRDTILSFNYDCVMDHALRSAGGGKWASHNGYGFPKNAVLTGTQHWDADNPPAGRDATIRLLKLHGSLNWQIDQTAVRRSRVNLKQRLYQQNGTPRFTIIPPEALKSIDTDPLFRRLWRDAGTAIAGARTIAVVGFSFTPTDLHVEALFRLALAQNKRLETLIIANPAPGVRRRTRDVFSHVLARGILVRQYDDLGAFATSIDGGTW